MKRLRGAPDLRNPQNTAYAIESVIDKSFNKQDRICLKVYFIQAYANMGVQETLNYLGLPTINMQEIKREIKRKRKNSIEYSNHFDSMRKALISNISERREEMRADHLRTILKRLA